MYNALTRSTWWNKSTGTSAAAAACTLVGLLLPDPLRLPVLYTGLFAVSGAVTNWLAIHMLFERVPGLYGSGVIPERFEDIKTGIQKLVMEQFFSTNQFSRLFGRNEKDGQKEKDGEKGGGTERRFDFDPIIDQTDVSPMFDALISVVGNSSLGGLLGMFGGPSALEPLRDPFAVRVKQAIKDLAKTDAFQNAVQAQLSNPSAREALRERIATLVQQRLDELTPQQVKEIMQRMIHKHLGWLVVWGGVFGGLMGLVTSLLPFVRA